MLMTVVEIVEQLYGLAEKECATPCAFKEYQYKVHSVDYMSGVLRAHFLSKTNGTYSPDDFR